MKPLVLQYEAQTPLWLQGVGVRHMSCHLSVYVLLSAEMLVLIKMLYHPGYLLIVEVRT